MGYQNNWQAQIETGAAVNSKLSVNRMPAG